MHRKNRKLLAAFRGLLLGSLIIGWVAGVRAEEEQAPTETRSGETVTVSVGAKKRLQMKAKLPIQKVDIEKPQVLRAEFDVSDPTVLILTGLQSGTTGLVITGFKEDKTTVTEQFVILVQTDIELLQATIRRAVPTASVEAVPGPSGGVILQGWVAHSEDIDIIMRIAAQMTAGSASPAGVVNAMKVGGVMQVQLDVVVARVARTETRRMNVDLWENGLQHTVSSTQGNAFLFPLPGTGITGNPLGSFTIQNQVGQPNGAPTNIFLSIFNGNQSVFAWFQALRDNQLAKLLAEPHLVTLSGKPATFLSGGDQAVPDVSGFGGTAGVTFVPFGTRLQFLPIVLGNGKIYLEVEPEVSVLDASSGVVIPGGGLVPGRQTQRVHTSVTMEDGQTLVIGGLIQNRVEADSTRLPLLGDLPFLGVLFTRKEFRETEEELVVMVTPRLVDPMDCKQAPKVLPGMETRTPDDFEFFLENILEAPRGQREVCPNRHYVPAWMHSPTAQRYPCGKDLPMNCNCCDGCGQGCDTCGAGCANGSCGAGCSTCGTNNGMVQGQTMMETGVPMPVGGQPMIASQPLPTAPMPIPMTPVSSIDLAH